jgi:hypothetical protein
MSHLDLPPDEDWWERALLKREKDTALFSANRRPQGSRAPSKEDASLEAAAATWEVPESTFWDLEVRDPEYAPLAASAHEFTKEILARRDLPDGYDMLRSAALKVSAHLSAGHSLGYDDSVLCGHIVKCRWALSECRFCEESLSHVVRRIGRPEFAGLLDRSRALARAIEERIDLLRERVWW